MSRTARASTSDMMQAESRAYLPAFCQVQNWHGPGAPSWIRVSARGKGSLRRGASHMAAALHWRSLPGWPISTPLMGARMGPWGHPHHLSELSLPLAVHQAELNTTVRTSLQFSFSVFGGDGARPCPALSWMGEARGQTPCEDAEAQRCRGHPAPAGGCPGPLPWKQSCSSVWLRLFPFSSFIYFSASGICLFWIYIFFNICASFINFSASRSDGLT